MTHQTHPPTNRKQKRQRIKAARRERLRWPKRCSCGKAWTKEAWLTRPEVGVQDLGHGPALDLKNCTCGSTMVVPRDFLVPVAPDVVR